MKEQGISVVGAGGWGTALALLLARAGRKVTLWARDPAKAQRLARHRVNETYLPGHRLPETVDVTSQLAEAAQNEAIILAVPSQAVRALWTQLAPLITGRHSILNAAKGIEVATSLTLSQVLLEGPSPLKEQRLAVLSGPNHAEEVAAGLPTASVVAAYAAETAERWQSLMMTSMFRVYTSDDVLGVELGGALKNVIALAAGIADGLGYGDNTKAAIVTRGLAEISRLGVAMGADPLTFSGLSGVGDLVATCLSRHSRNARAGRLIGQGASAADVMNRSPQVIEGIPTCQAALQLSERYGVELPITKAVASVLFEGKSPRDAVAELMGREPTSERRTLFP